MTPRTPPRVRGNDWSVLEATRSPAPTPRLTVSVVVPAYRSGATLDHTLAALAAQSYPAELLEVVVVDDDGAGEGIRLPELRPTRTRVVRAGDEGWGRAHACRTGADASDGEVIHWLDSDMVPCRDHVARQMGWHHQLDHVVVLGHKLFVDDTDLPSAEEVHRAVLEDRLETLFAGRATSEHDWVEAHWRRTDDLRTAGFRAFHVHVGATASVSRALYAEAGGMDGSLRLGEDIELGYRLAARGAVFVPDRSATAWHLGPSSLMRHGEAVQRHNAPFLAQRIPDFRKFRHDVGRAYRVPLVEAVVDAAGASAESTRFTVDGLLAGCPSDVRCLLVGPWSELDETRRELLGDPLLDLRLLREEYAADDRVCFVDSCPESAFPAQFRLHVPVGWAPGAHTLDDLTRDMQLRAQGLRTLVLPDGRQARLECTAAFERARRLVRAGEELDDVVDETSGAWWSEGVELGFRAWRPDGPPTHAGARRRRRAEALAKDDAVAAAPHPGRPPHLLDRLRRRRAEAGR